jgi:hypothetical protein
MRNKILLHVARNLCEIFCGWRAWEDREKLMRRHPNEVVIDVLADECRLDNGEVIRLSSSEYIREWVRRECEISKIEFADLRCIQLTLGLRYYSRIYGANTIEGCEFRCSSLVRHHDSAYTYEDRCANESCKRLSQ